jgi:hypothetical protein
MEKTTIVMDEITLNQLEELQKEMEPYKDSLVLDFFEVVKLEGVEYDEGDDGWPSDFFWVYRKLDGKIYWSSCCGRWTPLKGKIDDDEYNNLERVWNLNYHKDGKEEARN